MHPDSTTLAREHAHVCTDTHAHRHTLSLTLAKQALTFEVGILNCKQLHQNKTGGGAGEGRGVAAGTGKRGRSKPKNSLS